MSTIQRCDGFIELLHEPNPHIKEIVRADYRVSISDIAIYNDYCRDCLLKVLKRIERGGLAVNDTISIQRLSWL